MHLESLPDELLLLTFQYLHQFDILYSFTNLNRRFQQLSEPYGYDVDLTYDNMPSYQLRQIFFEHILPLYGSNIRSLKLSGHEQIQLLKSHIHRLINIQSFVLNVEKDYESDPEFSIEKLFLIDTLSASSSLSELSIFPTTQQLLRTIALNASSNLTTLTLIFSRDIPNFVDIPRLFSIKRLSINLWSLKATIQLLRILPNLEELNLSILRFKNSKNFHQINVPPTLKKLHLEINGFVYFQYGPKFEFIYQFLNIFKNHIQSLSLIFNAAIEEFSNYNIFQSIVNDFIKLDIFRYYIRTMHKPDLPTFFSNVEQLQDSSYIIYTQPRLVQFDTVSCRLSASYSFGIGRPPEVMFNYQMPLVSFTFCNGTLQEARDSNVSLHLINMHEIYMDSSDVLSVDACKLILEAIANSSNITPTTISYMASKKCNITVESKPCEKSSIATCDGCNQSFCLPHLTTHHQQLTIQMEALISIHDLLHEELDKPHDTLTGDLPTYVREFNLIDTWKDRTIAQITKQITQEADRTRNVIRQIMEENQRRVDADITAITKGFKQLKDRLSTISEQLQARMRSGDYLEPDIHRWNIALDDIKRWNVTLQTAKPLVVDRLIMGEMKQIHIDASNVLSIEYEKLEHANTDLQEIIHKLAKYGIEDMPEY
ncbi:hypothetical protein I4U23_013017 [Adineta vaga]|nr:hypothetical protein I4U23_013017 [Adineta vaga]